MIRDSLPSIRHIRGVSSSSSSSSETEPLSTPRRMPLRKGPLLVRSHAHDTPREPAPLPRPALIPAHAPRAMADGPSADTGPQAELARWATRHLGGLTMASKAAAFEVWAGASAGQQAGTIASVSLHELGPVGAPFAVLAIGCAFYDVYSTATDARLAKADYQAARVMRSQQETLLNELNGKDLPPDQIAPYKALIQANIEALDAFATTYEKAYFGEAERPHAARARERLRELAGDVARLATERDELEAEIQRLSGLHGVPGSSAEAVTQTVDALKAQQTRLADVTTRLDKARADMATCLSRKGMRAQVQQSLDAARAERATASPSAQAALDAKIEGLEKDLDDLASSLPRLFVAPTASLGSQQIKLVRALGVFLPGALVSTGSTTVALLHAAQVAAGLTVGASALSLVAAPLTVAAARYDMGDALKEKTAASAAKATAVRQAADSASLFLSCAHSNSVPLRACKYMAWSHLRVSGRALRVGHRATVQAGARYIKGVLSGTNSLALAIPMALLVLTGTAMAAIPAAVAAGAIGLVYCGLVGARGLQNKIAKDKLKEQAAVAEAFVRQFGAEAIEALHTDAAQGRLSEWNDRIADLREVAKDTNEDIPSRALTAAALLENQYLAIARLVDGLHRRARDHGIDQASAEADVARELARIAGKPDPTQVPLAGFANAAEHKADLRRRLCAIYNVKDYSSDRLPLADAIAPPAALAKDINETLARDLRRLDPDGELQAFVNAVAAEPERFAARWQTLTRPQQAAFRELLSGQRERLARHHFIGPEQLWEVQQWLTEGGQLGDGPLSSDSALHWLELLADPSWLTPRAPSDGGVLKAQAQLDGKAMAGLIKAVKDVGIEMRDGPSLKTGAWSLTPGARPPGMLERKVRALGLIFSRMGRNPTATPERALDHLRQTPAGEQSLLLQRFFLQFLKEMGGPTLMLPRDPDVMARLGHDPSPNEVSQAHARDLLRRARDAAMATQDALDAAGDHQRDSRSIARLRDRAQHTAALCDELIGHLHEPWLQGTLSAVDVR